MRYLVPFLMILVLASCDATTDTTNLPTSDTQINTSSTNESLSDEINSMDSNEIDDDKVVTLDASYLNPEGEEVPLEVNYSLDKEGKIDYIDLEGYSHNGFIATVERELMGKTLEDATNLYVAGASLATDSFQKAIKSSM